MLSGVLRAANLLKKGLSWTLKTYKTTLKIYKATLKSYNMSRFCFNPFDKPILCITSSMHFVLNVDAKCLEIIKFLFEAHSHLVQGPSCEPLRGSCMVFHIEIGSSNR